jgi:hypothetical protein
MILRLAESLAVPLRERNDLLLTAGFAPVYSRRFLEDETLSAARKAVEPATSPIPRWRWTALEALCNSSAPLRFSERRSM